VTLHQYQLRNNDGGLITVDWARPEGNINFRNLTVECTPRPRQAARRSL